jgi:hypothetical protein
MTVSNKPILMTDTELEEKLKRVLAAHVGRENAIPRWELVVECFGPGSDIPRTDDNLYDRAVRVGVERLRIDHGVFVLDMNDGRGRFLARDDKEYWAFRVTYLKPLQARARVIKALDGHARQKWPNLMQPSLFDIPENLEMA